MSGFWLPHDWSPVQLVHCCSIFLWDLDWKYSARWEPSIWRCRLLSALQRAEMTDLDHFFCMRYFSCIWRAPSKIFVHFFLLWPPQKGRSFHSGCFFQKCCSTTFLACFFPFTNHATSLHARNVVRTTFMAGHYKSYWQVTSPMPDCFAQNAARAAILAGWSNPNPMYLPCIYAAADDSEALQSRLWKYWVALLQSNTSFGNSVLS